MFQFRNEKEYKIWKETRAYLYTECSMIRPMREQDLPFRHTKYIS